MIEYSIDKKNGVTYAKFSDGWYTSLIAMLDKINPEGDFATKNDCVLKILSRFKSTKAKSRVCYCDKYDEKIGKEVAAKKLLEKFNRAKNAVLENYYITLVKNHKETLKRIGKKMK